MRQTFPGSVESVENNLGCRAVEKSLNNLMFWLTFIQLHGCFQPLQPLSSLNRAVTPKSWTRKTPQT